MNYAPETTVVTLAILALTISHSLVHAGEVTHGHVEVTAMTRGVTLRDGFLNKIEILLSAFTVMNLMSLRTSEPNGRFLR